MKYNTKKKVVSGVFWNGIQLVINQSFAFLIRLILAKLLFPEQFGIIGMATLFTGFVQVCNDLGIGAALIQRKEETLTKAHFHTAFWTGVAWSTFLYLIISFALAPVAAIFFKEPILTILIPVLSIGILSSPVNLVHKAQLTKAMDFKTIGFVENISSIAAGCVALALAYFGAGVWSLAFNSVAAIFIAMPLYFKATKWKPALTWNQKAFKEIFGFGIYTTGTSIVNYFINHIDYLLIGKLLSAQALGAYTFAFILTDVFRSRLSAVLNNVMYPVYGKNQNDPKSLKNYYLKVINYNSILVFPIMTFFLVLGRPFVFQFFGDKWAGSIEPLQILSLSVMVHMLVNSNTALIRGMGRPKLELKLQLIKAVIFIPMLVYGIVYYGIVGGAWAILINKVIAVAIAQYTFNYLLFLKVSFLEFFAAVKYPWLGALSSYLTAFILFKGLGVPYLVAGFFLFVVYFLTIWVNMRSELSKIINAYKLSGK